MLEFHNDQLSGANFSSWGFCLVICCLTLLCAGFLAGCVGSNKVLPPAPESVELAADANLPVWIIEAPKAPGEAFYASAAGTARGSASLAMADADAAARVALARMLDTTVQAVFKRYLREIAPDSEKSNAEALVQDTARLLTDLRLSGIQIDRRQPSRDGHWFSLARISFDDLASAIKKSAQKNIKSVRANSAQAFEELDRLLSEESK